jgi:hypothetical protein
MNLLGLPLEIAAKHLAGAPYRVRRLDNYWSQTGDWRVIKQEIQDGVTVLTVTLFRCICLSSAGEAQSDA